MNQLRTLCVMGTFDDAANQAVSQIKEQLKVRGIGVDAYEPHVTFGIYTGLDEAPLLEWVAEVAARHPSIPLCFNHFGFFPDAYTCFLAPCPDGALLRLHSDIRQQYDDRCADKGCLYSLEQKNWAPHMTVASIGPGQAEGLLSVFREGFSPFRAVLTELQITSSEQEGALGSFKLRDI